MTTNALPFLRTLAPLLRSYEEHLQAWLAVPPTVPRSLVQATELATAAEELVAKSAALHMDQPILNILFMGGTGVGKSSLLNALAGAAVAQASFLRPTTREAVVYHHESIAPQTLDPLLQKCRRATHRREALLQKILIDTPDLDSNDRENRDRLAELLPVADVVLYVGSQEKYHDQLGWQLFQNQQQRRAFAFILNKWDRASDTSTTGKRPDEDWLEDLRQEGYAEPRLFRTQAQAWIDCPPGTVPQNLAPGEQFAELQQWLELGLTRLEVEAVKARGVGQLLEHLQKLLRSAKPADLVILMPEVRSRWSTILHQEADATAEILVSSMEPLQSDIEHHFLATGRQRFRGFMAAYLRATTRLRYVGTRISERQVLRRPGN
ncbi:MAG: GTPase, partial [Gemmataceae bacterium]